ncbi:MAG: hypothetical protein IJU61_04210, partial [Victivallales bacterium]|nr:hypothetical protein [Victivallales bacterium]
MDTNYLGKPQNTRNTPKCLAARPTVTEGFIDNNKPLIMNDANGSGGCGGCHALRGGKKCHAIALNP